MTRLPDRRHGAAEGEIVCTGPIHRSVQASISLTASLNWKGTCPPSNRTYFFLSAGAPIKSKNIFWELSMGKVKSYRPAISIVGKVTRGRKLTCAASGKDGAAPRPPASRTADFKRGSVARMKGALLAPRLRDRKSVV